MNPVYPLSSLVAKEEEEEEDPNLKLYIFSPSSQASSSSSQLAFATCFSSTTQHDQRGSHLHLQDSHHQLRHDHQAEKSIGGISNEGCQVIFSSTSLLKSSVGSCKPDNDQELEDQSKLDNRSAKYWMSSKMRLMQKMMINTDKKAAAANSDHHKPASPNTRNKQNFGNHRHGKWEITRSSCSNGGHNNNGVRVCSDCNTTTTPLWRSGPQGPKSLCNACGIRQRKARRAMAEAASGGGGGGSVVVASEAALGKQLHKEKKSRTSCHGDAAIVAHVKNKCSKMADNSSDSQSEGNVSFDHNFTLRLSKRSSAFGRVFPRDEEEAAILLMELSCGLVHSC